MWWHTNHTVAHNKVYFSSTCCLEAQMTLCTGQSPTWHSLEQYRMLSSSGHPAHLLCPNIMPQNEQGTALTGRGNRRLIFSIPFVHRSSVEVFCAIIALQMIKKPLVLKCFCPLQMIVLFSNDSRSFSLIPRMSSSSDFLPGIRVWNENLAWFVYRH